MDALDGLRVVNTRSKEQAGELNELLRAAGAIPLSYPCISIVPVANIGEFDETLQQQSFDWICLTSQNAVEMLAIRANAIGLDRDRLTVHGRIVALDATEQVDVRLERDVFDEAGAIAAGASLAIEALHSGAAELLAVTA